MAVFAPNPTEKLDQELDTARQLMTVLKEEQSQLIKANIDSLEPLVGKKSALIARMSELAKARLTVLTQMGYPAEEASMQKWLDSPAAQSIKKAPIKKTWDELRAIIRSSKALNRTNGLLISTHMSRSQAALQVLQGNQGGAQVYGRNGQTSVQTTSRSLVVG
ncbi:MAG: flagellar protein FlgN [Oxalobacter sp.]|nr:MAG: flagellar protein FlgN [Oxalobacter sp.]